CDSVVTLILTINESTNETINLSTCNSIEVNGITYTEEGMFMQSLVADNGCDSTLLINISKPEIESTFEIIEDTLKATVMASSYQWWDCSANEIIDGADGEIFVSERSGNYALIVDNGSCFETSACAQVISTSIHNLANVDLKIFPNPTEDILKL
ncbi:MAG: hypothetical protein AAGK97_14770, partial [Bacteroidota bacterium]